MKPDCTRVRPADNPFASRFIDNIEFDFRWGDSEENYCKNLEKQQYRGAIIGKHTPNNTNNTQITGYAVTIFIIFADEAI